MYVFLWMSVYLFICLSVYLPVCLSHCLSVCLPDYACTAYPISGDIFESYLQSSKLKLVGLFCKFQRKETCELWLRALLRALENFSSGGIGCMYVRQGACNHDCLFESKYFLIAFLSLSIA